MEIPSWNKKGLIFTRTGGVFFKTHTMRAVPYLRQNGILRLFISSRCQDDMMHPTYIDVDPNNPSEVIDVGEKPLLKIGSPGLFDDSGITLASIVRTKTDTYCYYTGWKRRRYGVSFELSIGVARLLDDGEKLEKLFIGPILGQDRSHPFLVAGPYVLRSESEGFRMWYCSGTDWQQRDHGPEPIYTVFTARSNDGLTWEGFSSDPVIDYNFDHEVISAPWVTKLANGYLMHYPFRGSITKSDKNYTIGVAISKDGTSWARMDEEVGIQKSENGWDSEMICYPAIFNSGDKTYMFYSGNGVGKGGIGYAVADKKLEVIDN
ncbi:hypothetical protein OAQ34_05040 [Opitutales bacterium]|nr:hypothetical protein [Opitutales bacterium]